MRKSDDRLFDRLAMTLVVPLLLLLVVVAAARWL
jgi:hypothetical protein